MDLSNVLQLQGLAHKAEPRSGATWTTTTCIWASCLSNSC